MFLVPVVAVPPATAQATCAPAAGAQPAPAVVEGNPEVAIVGRGFGHGVGLSQEGAQGAAQQGCNEREILAVYYPGAPVRTRPSPDVVRLGFGPRWTSSHYTTGTSPVTWTLVPCVVSSSSCDRSTAGPPQQPAGATWRVTVTASGGYSVQRQVRSTGSSGQTIYSYEPVWSGGDRFAELRVDHHGRDVQVHRNASPTSSPTWRVRWGTTVFDTITESSGATMFVVQHIRAADGVPAMERYLWGLAEVPNLWEPAAQRAQAVAARSYAHSITSAGSRFDSCRCDLLPSTADQHYTGAAKEDEDARFGLRWRDAVTATRDVIVTTSSGAPMTAYYSASHGGMSESGEAAQFGNRGDRAHLRAIDTAGWESVRTNLDGGVSQKLYPGVRGTWRAWYRPLTESDLVARVRASSSLRSQVSACGFTPTALVDARVVSVGPGGQPAAWRDREAPANLPDGVKVVLGDGGSRTCDVWASGNTFRSVVQVPSPTFTIRLGRALSNGGTPVTGDVDGDGQLDVGWFKDGAWAWRTAAGADQRFSYGMQGDTPVVGDWNGDGHDTVGVRRGNRWLLTDTERGGDGRATHDFRFGTASMRPLVGDFNSDGRDSVAVVDGNRWYLTSRLPATPGTDPVAAATTTYGRAGWTPVTGNWDGIGGDGIAMRDGTRWYLAERPTASVADRVQAYGSASARPLRHTAGAGFVVVQGIRFLVSGSTTTDRADRVVEFEG